MLDGNALLGYLQRGVDSLLNQDGFDGGQRLRRTQKQALEAYKKYLNNSKFPTDQKLKGFFEIATGIGKTAIFVGIIGAAYRIAEKDGIQLKTAIVVPTNQLLHDTPKDIETFAPHLKGKIGLYGDGRKNLKMPITIMTYDAWYDLSVNGKIGSHNTDILISDEAHRGTSERRIENIKGVFNGQTAQIAFTATAHFDEEKSVQASHEREIFYKGIRDGVKEGELASYISSQRTVVRVEPTDFMLSDQFECATKEEQIAYSKKLRQKTWNKHVVKLFREGRDNRTQDLLSDNQAGFFVEGIHQANQLEKMLNADAELQKRAIEQGRKGVAVAIHSKLSSSKEVRRRFAAYKAGEYMAVVGDEKFKEGFDHQPMKTIFDTMHASVVDKAQILGRGARKWWNEAKQRFEGLTVIDTAIYIGDEDKEEDEKLRRAALRRAVSVKQILEDSFVAGPAAPPQIKRSRGGRSSESIFDDDLNIEYYAEVEDVYLLEEEVFKLRREHLEEILPEIKAKINAEEKRTGLGGCALFAKMKSPPEGLDSHKTYVIVAGKNKTAEASHITSILETYADQPDAKIKSITELERKQIREQVERTGLKGMSLFELIKVKPSDLTKRNAIKIISGQKKSAKPSHITVILETYAAQPDAKMRLITELERKQMREQVERTGLGGYSLFDKMDNPPEGLDKTKANSIISGATKTAEPSHIEAILNAFSVQSDVKKRPILELERRKIRAHAERTGMEAYAALSVTETKLPEGLSFNKVSGIVSGRVKSAKPEHIKVILDIYANLPDKAL
ncbi:DEAD/DEAH box helicase [Cerasicoccus frondis]|uniref:DEAD/DEAH box helicase n=1 Tax=Cerasicoccus frondis TaxID=490090 RepID=UPI002852B55D|nr:DEAD/DEAH box helicase family protein [Cerasicoccus frondis]